MQRRDEEMQSGDAPFFLLDLLLELASRLSKPLLEAFGLIALGLGLLLCRLARGRLRLGRLERLARLIMLLLELLIRVLPNRLAGLVEQLPHALLPRLRLLALLLELSRERASLLLREGLGLLQRLDLRAHRPFSLLGLLGIDLLLGLARAHEGVRVTQQVELARIGHRLLVRGDATALGAALLQLHQLGAAQGELACRRLGRLLEARDLKREQLVLLSEQRLVAAHNRQQLHRVVLTAAALALAAAIGATARRAAAALFREALDLRVKQRVLARAVAQPLVELAQLRLEHTRPLVKRRAARVERRTHLSQARLGHLASRQGLRRRLLGTGQGLHVLRVVEQLGAVLAPIALRLLLGRRQLDLQRLHLGHR